MDLCRTTLDKPEVPTRREMIETRNGDNLHKLYKYQNGTQK